MTCPRVPGLLAMLIVASLAAMPMTSPADAAEPRFERERRAMLAAIEADVAATARETGRARLDDRVVAAMAGVERHRFVPPDQQAHAYENRALPIGHGQTISQPFIVALMTDLLAPRADDIVLEIGTGSGYQAAVLAHLVRRVYTIEIVPSVARAGAKALAAAGYRNVETRIGDGYAGWPEAAPFDGIVITAAPPAIPAPLLAQLKPGGRMVVPVGADGETQELRVLTRQADGSVTERRVLAVRFVPFTRSR